MNIKDDGRIGNASDACDIHDIDPATVDHHIARLGLNVDRLCISREMVWQALAVSFAVFIALPDHDQANHLTRFAESQLLPKPDGRLAPFFTTARSFFGPLAEAILAAPPQAWI